MSFGKEEAIFAEESDDLSSVKSDDQSSVKSDDSSGSSNRVKFLYSYGGRIFPRPGDGKLRYVGGQTRVVAANRSISFADLMAKLGEIRGCSVVLKCQLPTEDLDALVSIKSDEDLENMLEEYDRLKEGSSKVRAFLFPKPQKPNTLSESLYLDFHRPYPHPSQYPSQQYVQGACKPGKPPRCPPQHADVAYNSPVRYAIRSATQIHNRIQMPRQQKPVAYVDEGQYVRMGNGNYQYILSAPPSAQVRIPGKATRVSEEYSKNPYILHHHHNSSSSSSYHGGGLGGFRSQEQFVVQH